MVWYILQCVIALKEMKDFWGDGFRQSQEDRRKVLWQLSEYRRSCIAHRRLSDFQLFFEFLKAALNLS